MTTMTDELHDLRNAVEQRDREIAKLKTELEKTSAKLTDTATRLNRRTLEYRVAEAAHKLGIVDDRAVADLTDRAIRAGEWQEDDRGRLCRLDSNGFRDESVFQWMSTSAKAEAPWFFKDSAPTNAVTANANTGNTPAPRASVGSVDGVSEDELRKIFHPATMNLTRATEIEQTNPELAARIAKEVGNKIFMPTEQPARRFGR